MGVVFFINSVLLGVGLAMDAFSVSVVNGLNEPKMKKNRICLIAGTFSFFQIIMPLIGWLCVHMLLKSFMAFEKFIPWIALALLAYIGGKMLLEGIRGGDDEDDAKATAVTFGVLIAQGIATSIDALSVGFAIADYNGIMALICALIVGVVTFMICLAGLYIGKKFGTVFSNKANILGGVVLIGIGLEIFIRGVFF